MTNNNEEAGVMQAVDGFYKALNTMFTGDVGAIQKAWSHQDDVSYMGPAGGVLVGWSDVEKSWQEQAALKLGGSISPKNMHVVMGQDVAIVINTEEGENVAPDGQTVEVSIRVTSTFRNEDGQWKMIGHHSDLLPFLQN
jgi:ketosteroid isomerase-like protein